MRQPVHTYNDGQPYRPARGRDLARTAIEDHWRLWNSTHAVVDLATEQPTPQAFVSKMIREMKIRGYAHRTITAYQSSLTQFFRWFSHLPHEVTREDVREFLELIVDAEKDTATLALHLTALRTTLDKMCGRDVTLGLVTPRKSKHIPVVLSRHETQSLISAADRRREKLLVALLYGSGVRVSEVVKLQVRDFDFDRCLIRIRRAKGRKDRMVLLPKSFLGLIKSETTGLSSDNYLFPSPKRTRRHLSPRTVQRQLHRIATIAGIQKNVTPHTLRHSFACHALENGMDIRHIQELLGHANLETTTIYTKLAKTQSEHTHSPLDVTRGFTADRTPADPVATMTVHARPHPDQTEKRTLQVTIEIKAKRPNLSVDKADPQSTAAPIFLTGALAIEQRPGYLSVSLPSSAEWDAQLTSAPNSVRERIAEPHFYRVLTEAIETKFLQQKW